MIRSVFLIEYLTVDVLKIIEEFLIPYSPIRHSWKELALRGCLEGLQWSYRRKKGVFSKRFLLYAVRNGHLHVLEWFYENFGPFGSLKKELIRSCEYGHLHIVRWLHDHDSSPNNDHGPSLMNIAAENGHLHIVQWLHRHRTEGCTYQAMDLAASNGHLEMVQWLHAHRTEGCSSGAMDYASEMGHLNVVQWLHENYSHIRCTDIAMDCAASNGHLEIVRWLHSNRTEGCTHRAMDWAAQYGHLEIVQWLHYNRTEGCTHRAMDWAAQNGHLEIMQWLHFRRAEGCTVDAMDFAAGNGHLNIVQWLHANRVELGLEEEGCTERAIDWAAANGHLEVLRWMTEHRVGRVSRRAMLWATENRNYMVVRWLHETWNEPCTTTVLYALAEHGALEIIVWFYDKDRFRSMMPHINFRTFISSAAVSGNIFLLQWIFVTFRDQFHHTQEATYEAIGCNYISIAEFLFERGDSVCNFNCFFKAIVNNHLDMFFWLSRKFPEDYEIYYRTLVTVGAHVFPSPHLKDWIETFCRPISHQNV